MDIDQIQRLTDAVVSARASLKRAQEQLTLFEHGAGGYASQARISINGVAIDLLEWSPNGFVVGKKTKVIFDEARAYLQLRIDSAKGAVEGAEFNLRREIGR